MSRRRERGFALLIVLVTLALLAVLVGAVAAGGRGEARLAGNLRLGAMAQAAADGAVWQAAFHALDGGKGHWPADGIIRRINVGGVPVAVRVANEAGKVNPNLAAAPLLAGLLQAVGADHGTAIALAAAMVAWRTPGRANAAAYVAAGRTYAPPGAKFQRLDELRLVLGMTPVLFARLAPHLSLARDRPPDPAAADPLVRQALATVGGGQPIVPAGAPADESVVRITAAALGPGAARFVRQAVVRLEATRVDAPVRVLSWRALALDDLPAAPVPGR